MCGYDTADKITERESEVVAIGPDPIVLSVELIPIRGAVPSTMNKRKS